MCAEIDFGAEGLLDGLEGAARAERERLLARLMNEGHSLVQLRNATASGGLIFLGADGLVGGGQLYSVEDIAELSGLDAEFIRTTMRATGLAVPEPGEKVLGEANLQLARIGREYKDLGLSDEDLLEMPRVVAMGLHQVAEAMRQLALKMIVRPGASEEDLAVDFAQAASALLPSVDPLLSVMMRLQLGNVVRTQAVNAAEREAGTLPGARDVTVCFADLVGFTRVGEQVPLDELGRIATQLERITAAAISHPVRLVKTLGDGVMLVSPDPGPLVDGALSLLEAIEDSDLPQLRVGVASGPALNRSGDWYGRPVNLASRITAVARPGSALATEELRDLLPDAYAWSFAGPRRLKGIREPVPLYRVRRPA